MTKSNASANVVAVKQQHRIQWEINAYFTKDHPNNLKEADLVKEKRQINQQLRVFMNDISSVLDSSRKSKSTCLNKQQHHVQCEIRKLNRDYPTDLKCI